MDDTKCFARTPTLACMALDTGMHKNRCTGSEGCAFYKTAAAQRVSENAALERIATLPDGEQQYIADKYHQGKMPWMQMNGR